MLNKVDLHGFATLDRIGLAAFRWLRVNQRDALVALCAASVFGVASAQWPNLPAAPLSLQGVGDPNIVLTIDDSGSMNWDAMPDSRAGSTSIRRLAAKWNQLAYNPFVVYEAPFDPVLLDGSRTATSFTAALIDGFVPGGGTENLSNNYQTHWAYTPGTTGGCYGTCTNYGPGRVAMDDRGTFPISRAYFYSFYNDLGPSNAVPAPGTNPTSFVRNTVRPAGCNSVTDINNNSCYVRISVPTAHEANFARWFSFYRNRNFLTATAANLALYDLPLNYRVAWQSLNRCATGFNNTGCAGWDGVSRANYMRPLTDSTHRSNLFQWLGRVGGPFGTPLVQAVERAGAFYQSTGINSPRANQPGVSETGPGTAPINVCRPNYHVMMTDGLWNGGASTVVNVNADNSGATLPDGQTYSPRAPFSDTASSTIADIAFRYWATDLQPGIADNLIPYFPDSANTNYWDPKNDPATWQHMVNFNVGLGLTGILDNSCPTGNCTDGQQPQWGGDTYSGTYPAIFAGTRQWPPAANGNSFTVADLWHAAINSRGLFFSADTPDELRKAFRDIVARIKAGQTSSGQRGTSSKRVGSGSLAFDIGYDAGNWTGTLKAYNLFPDGTLGALAWSTDTTFTNATGRNIFTWDTGSSAGEAFVWASFTNAQKTSWFNNDANLFNYLTGDRSLEGSSYRIRNKLLGDIIGSDLVVSGKSDLGYAALPAAAGGSTYKAYVATKQNVAYFGANDGMLHAFRRNGSEAFAYVPSAVLPKLKGLASNPYVHEAMVDGPVGLWDAYTGGAWKSILVGGLGGGGKSFFALDVTNVTTNASGSFNASNVLFELNDADIGYTFTRPIVGRQRNGDWVAFFSNGYGGTSRRAVLFIKNLTTGTLTKIDTGAGTAAVPNGLASPVGLSTQVGEVEAVYAGDYLGNLWKFAPNASGVWSVANSGSPLFVAQDSGGVRQPIFAAPTLATHPAGGIMVYVGTGKFFESQDRTDTSVQTFYALRDTGSSISGRSALTQQTVVSGNTSTSNQRTVSANTVDYSTKRGWYLDLNSTDSGSPTGEKVVSSAVMLNGIVLFNTFLPSRLTCTGLGTSFLMSLGAFTGTLSEPVFDENGDGKIDAGDLVGGKPVAGTRSSGDGSLMSPIATLVGLQSSGSANATPGVCGGLNQAPCPPNRCDPGLILKGATCGRIVCPTGSIMVNNEKCSVNTRRAVWMELR